MNNIINLVTKISEEEFVVIEMQGNITHSIENKYFNLHLGKIENISKDVYKFIIGNHHVMGKKIDLKNPILVCKKEKIKGGNVEVVIEKIIKSKILFNSRPTPVITPIE